jgi:type I site-specific restriction-modification system R (restriction) subunit
VIADEAHRSQYDFIDGFARHMRDALPHASFIRFTGTPIELQDANNPAVFGDYISVYDIQRAVQDGATVPIYYESRLAKLALDTAERVEGIEPFFEMLDNVLRNKLQTFFGSDDRFELRPFGLELLLALDLFALRGFLEIRIDLRPCLCATCG